MLNELVDIAKFILGFLPWILFLLLPTDSWDPLWRAVAICLAASVVLGWKELRKGFILQSATVLFFLCCTISFYGFGWIWLAQHMGIVANGFLAGIIWLTVLIGRPFTLQIARAELPTERWHDKELIRGCRFIAVFWGILLLVPTAASVFGHLYPRALPQRFYFYLSLCCIALGIVYTSYYKHMKRRQRTAMNNPAVLS